MAGKELRAFEFAAPSNPLAVLGGRVGQAVYLQHYLADLGASTVLVESNHWDRDYLAERGAFYGESSRSYPNTCERWHFFAGPFLTAERLQRLLQGGSRLLKQAREAYLGFSVVRPLLAAPFGLTVLRWYREHSPLTPRVTRPSRRYFTYLAGLKLEIEGLAWQQQDTAVGACATVALWSMLHSSAFDDHHAIPTTAQITRYAHRSASLGARVFPSGGLTIFQLCEAIKECGLAPVVMQGDVARKDRLSGFSRERFAAACSSMIRAGYPALLMGDLMPSGSPPTAVPPRHAICAVGFREVATPVPPSGKVKFQDEGMEYLYVHDDNLGPSVRFKLSQVPNASFVAIEPSAPAPVHSLNLPQSPTVGYPQFVPTQIVAAVHEELRTDADELQRRGLRLATQLLQLYGYLRKTGHGHLPDAGLTLATRFIRLESYLGDELERTLGSRRTRLGRVRKNLLESGRPLSRHIGLVRIGWGSAALLDVLFDTSDCDRQMDVLSVVGYQPLMMALARAPGLNLGRDVNWINGF